jgi:haloacetate dehalogenase
MLDVTVGERDGAAWIGHDPHVIHAMLEDYRAGLGVDRSDDDADARIGKTVTAPTLVLWAARDDLSDLFGDPLAIWRRWTRAVSGWPIEAGHLFAEEAPAKLAQALTSFLREPGAAAGPPRSL